jgi:hypothetical protein
MRSNLLYLAALAALGAGQAVAAVAPASFDWSVRDLQGNELDYGSFNLVAVEQGGKVIGYEVQPLANPITVFGVSGGQLVAEATITQVSGGGSWDPAFIYGLSVQDIGAPSVFSFTITAPLLPTVTPVPQIKANVAGTLTDQSGDGAALIPLGPGSTLQTVRLAPGAVNAGVDGGPAVPFSIAPGASGTFKAFAAYMPGPTAAETLLGPAGSYTGITIANTFQLSGGNDTFVTTGFVEVTAVPEPDARALMFAGMGLLGVVAWRKVRRG